MKTPHWINKLKDRWGIKGSWHVILVLSVFAATGMSTLRVEALISQWLKLSEEPTFINRLLVFVFLTLPVYNILLILIGSIVGQFRFFWNFEKKFFGSFGKLFKLRRLKK
jgi:hypothetical protein